MKAHTVGLLVFLSLTKTSQDHLTLDTADRSKKDAADIHVNAEEGSCAELKCRVNSIVDAGGATWYWMKDPKWISEKNGPSDYHGVVVYSNKASKWSEDYKGRVELITSPQSTRSCGRFPSCVRHCGIRICELNKRDAGAYMFRYETNYFKWSIPNKIQLTVEESPCPITFEELPAAHENQTVTLKCSTSASCPSDLQIDRFNQQPLKLPSHATPSPASKITTKTFQVTWEDDGAEFSCHTQNDRNVYLRRTMRLTVEYAPRDVAAASVSTVKEGDSVTLTCSGKGQPAPKLTWLKGNQLKSSTASWTIRSITEAQSGSYTCRAENKHGTKFNSVTITVIYVPQVEVKISDERNKMLEDVREGVRVKFYCNVKRSSPPPHSFTWFKDSTQLSSPNVNWEQQSVVFTVEPNDRGVYKCKASNSAGTGESRERHFQVKYKPRNTWISQEDWKDNHVKVNGSLRMTCNTQAYPDPWFSWYRYRPSDGSKLTHSISREKSLTLQRVRRADEACYTCNASNSVDRGDISEPLCIHVLFPPTRVVLTMDAEVREGQVVTVTCSAESSPPSTFTLYKSSKSTQTKITTFQGVKDINSVRHTFAATSSDGDDYTCGASNGEGSAKSASKKLVVKYAPKEVKIEAWYNLAVKENASFRLDCRARSHPPVTSTTWTKVTSEKSELIRITGSLVFVKSASTSDSGFYTCEATNEIGTGKSEPIEINVHYGPKHTRIIQGEEHRLPDGTSLVPLSCSALCYPPVKKYSWYRKADTGPGRIKISNSRNISVSSQEPGEYYCVAENEVSQRPSEVVPLFAGKVKQIWKLFSIFFFILFILFLVFLLFRHMRKKSVLKRGDTWWSRGFVARWKASSRMNVMNEASLTGPSRSRDDLLTHQTCPDSTPSSNASCVYSTVNLPKGESTPSAQRPARKNGARQGEESLHYVSLHFKNKNRKPNEEAVYAGVSKVTSREAKEKMHERFGDYENTTQAGRAPHPSNHKTDANEGDVEVTYSKVHFKTKVQHQRPERDSSSSEEDTLYSELKV